MIADLPYKWEAKLPLLMKTYTSICWPFSAQYPTKFTKFLWCNRPNNMTWKCVSEGKTLGLMNNAKEHYERNQLWYTEMLIHRWIINYYQEKGNVICMVFHSVFLEKIIYKMKSNQSDLRNSQILVFPEIWPSCIPKFCLTWTILPT